MSINGHKTSCTRTMYLRKKEKKRYIISSLHPSKGNNTSPNTMIQKLTLPLRVTTLIPQNYSPFLSRVTKDRVSSRHLNGRADISISIIGSIIVITIIIILNLKIKSHWRRWKRSLKNEAIHDRLLPCNTADMNVHLILKLHHDVSK